MLHTEKLLCLIPVAFSFVLGFCNLIFKLTQLLQMSLLHDKQLLKGSTGIRFFCIRINYECRLRYLQEVLILIRTKKE